VTANFEHNLNLMQTNMPARRLRAWKATGTRNALKSEQCHSKQLVVQQASERLLQPWEYKVLINLSFLPPKLQAWRNSTLAHHAPPWGSSLCGAIAAAHPTARQCARKHTSMSTSRRVSSHPMCQLKLQQKRPPIPSCFCAPCPILVRVATNQTNGKPALQVGWLLR
jgi:hypothetical protein